MKLISLFPALGLVLLILVLITVTLACTPKKVLQGNTTSNKEEQVEIPGNIVHRSIDLSSNAYKIVNEKANGIVRRDIGECLFLNLDGFKLLSEEPIGINIFLNDRSVDAQTSKESLHFIDSFIPGHGSHSEEGENYLFSLDKTVETLGDALLAKLDEGKIDISVVAFAVFGNPESVDKTSFTINSINIEVKCD